MRPVCSLLPCRSDIAVGMALRRIEMQPTDIMRGSPPAPEAQVTRANWRSFPAIRWGFTHTREVLPTAEIRRSAQPTLIPTTPIELAKLGFTSPDGKATTIEATLRETFADAFLVMH